MGWKITSREKNLRQLKDSDSFFTFSESLVAGAEGLRGVVDADPMVGEAECRLRRDGGHMAGGAGAVLAARATIYGHSACRPAVVAGETAFPVGILGGFLQRTVGIVASEAGELASAFRHALALSQVDRLMPDVPGVIPVDAGPGGGGRPVALSALDENLLRGGAFGIGDEGARLADVPARGGLDVGPARAVACFAANAGLGRLQDIPGADSDGTRGVAFEAAKDPDGGIFCLIRKAHRFGQRLGLESGVASGGGHGADGGVVREVVLKVPLTVDASHQSDGLFTGAEGPFDRDIDDVLLVVALGANSVRRAAIANAEGRFAREPFVGGEAGG